MIEDVLVKVDKFIFPTYFIVLDMEEDKEIPIILRVQDDEVKFNVFEAVKHPEKSDTCFMIETIEAIVSSQSGTTYPFELAWYRVNQKNWEKKLKSL